MLYRLLIQKMCNFQLKNQIKISHLKRDFTISMSIENRSCFRWDLYGIAINVNFRKNREKESLKKISIASERTSKRRYQRLNQLKRIFELLSMQMVCKIFGMFILHLSIVAFWVKYCGSFNLSTCQCQQNAGWMKCYLAGVAKSMIHCTYDLSTAFFLSLSLCECVCVIWISIPFADVLFLLSFWIAMCNVHS